MTSPSTRRHFLQSVLGASALSLLLPDRASSAAAQAPHFPPKVKRAIYLFMAGGPSQVDLFDYKPGLAALRGQNLPESARRGHRSTGMTSNQGHFRIAPSKFGFQQGGQSGAWVSDLLPFTRQMVDRLAIIKSVSTESVNHDLAVAHLNTGSPLPGKPALGAWLSYGLGRLADDVPTYVVMTSSFSVRAFVQALPARVWGNAFLPASHAGVPLRGVGDPVLFLPNPAGVSATARRRTLDAVSALNALSHQQLGDPSVIDRTAQYELAFRMQASVPGLTDFKGESASTLDLYGPDASVPGTFAANCLAARRMLEKGVRFVQIYHRGWDAHDTTPGNHTLQCKDIDQACHGLLTDLAQRGLLDDTLVIWGGEFGRTIYCQGELKPDDYGRDHHGGCFSMWLAGGGVRSGIVHGETDDFSHNVVKDEVRVHDLNATLLHLFGVDHSRLTFMHAGLAEKLTGVGTAAQVVQPLLA